MIAPARSRPAPVAQRRPLLRPGDAASVRAWLVTRAALLVLTWPALWIMQASSHARYPWPSLWVHWDAQIYVNIAAHGYGSVNPDDVAFFPGYPALLAFAHLLIPNWTIAGLAISLAAGLLAAIPVGRLGGSAAVLFLACSPAAVFLSAGYTEPVFLALAAWAWLSASQDRWYRAAFLAAAAGAVRIDGLFLIAGLTVLAITSGRPRRIPVLIISLIPAALYEAYLWYRTGDILAWLHAEAHGWGRHFTSPLSAFRATWHLAFGHVLSAPWAFECQLEILAAIVSLIFVGYLAAARRWPELAYCGLVSGALLTSTFFMSVPRSLLIMFPLWIYLAGLARRWQWITGLYLAVSIPLALSLALLYLTGSWAG
jgi:hypothetical protein